MASTSKDKQVRIMPARKWVSQEIPDEEKELLKAEFNEKIHAYFLLTRTVEECSKMSNLWSHDCLDPLILRIQKEKEKSGRDDTYIYYHEDKCMMVVIWKGKERLSIKDEYGKFKVILPWEDIFDIFWEMHIKYCHPSTETLKHILHDKYIVNDFAIQKICEVCYKCSKKQQPYLRCALDIISLNRIADYAFTQIMIYQDMYSGFIHLRPLSADSKESEICLELLRIFMDFGPPKDILISNDIFRVALDQIKHLTTFAPISIAVRKVKEDKTRCKHIKKIIIEWMNKNEFENWSIACYGVQAYLNNQSKGRGQNSPYDMVFKNIQMCSIEDLDEFDFVSFEQASSSEVNVDKSSNVIIDKSSDVNKDKSSDVNKDKSSDVKKDKSSDVNKNKSSDVNVDKGVFTTFSPADFIVTSKVSRKNRAEQASTRSSSPSEEQLFNFTDNFLFGSGTFDDELMPADVEDPLAIDWDIDDIDMCAEKVLSLPESK